MLQYYDAVLFSEEIVRCAGYEPEEYDKGGGRGLFLRNLMGTGVSGCGILFRQCIEQMLYILREVALLHIDDSNRGGVASVVVIFTERVAGDASGE